MTDLHDAAAAELWAAMDALHEELRKPELAPGEFTAAQFGERQNITTPEAARELEKAWRLGRVTRRKEWLGGHHCWVYRMTAGS